MYKNYNIVCSFGELDSRLTPELLQAIESVEQELCDATIRRESPLETLERRSKTIRIRRNEDWNFWLDVYTNDPGTKIFQRIFVSKGKIYTPTEQEEVLH